MSALTKVFVVLHVIVSLLLVAGMVVFVNKVEDFKALNKKEHDAAALANGVAHEAELKIIQVTGEAKAAKVEADNRALALVSDNQSLKSNMATLNTSLNAAIAAKAAVDTQVLTLTTAMKQAQDTMAATDIVINGLRTRGDEVEKKYTESQVALSDTNNRIDALNRELAYSKEQVVALETELTNVRQQLLARGAAPGVGGPGTVAPGNAIPAVPSNLTIRGVVKNKFQVGEVSYATVSVGSADSVSKGARFNVTDPSGQKFLGYLTIDSVNPNESSGHLNGPDVQSVQKGSTVVSNWQ